MKIEIAEPGRMTQTGSSLLKLIQNNNTPVLDLLVRESVQNSLDARKANAKYVDVEYSTGKFDSGALNRELEGISDAINNRFPRKEYDYIAIGDSNTVGLTGEMDYKKVKDNKYGNLLKLIYEICKPQDAEGAGGSWGLGKTVYFRIGIGLVIYYSRIINDNGRFEERLAASYVEDETKPNALLPVYKGQAKRGIAWWGDRIEENVTQPITNSNYIKSILNIFGIKPYEKEMTGTTIIIPYVDTDKLLSNNQIEYLDSKDDPIVPYWCHSIEEYLKIAVQRWYAPRLNNPYYSYGAYLRTRINGVGISKDSMEPVFKVTQALYNRANYVNEEDVFSGSDVEVKVQPIKVMKYLTDSTIGMAAFAKVHRSMLGMEAPTNKPEPFMYFNKEINDFNVNKPTICYTRKPGMIVSYENSGPWASNISASHKEEYIMGIFVLNTGVNLRNSPSNISLEEYVRHSEMADHTSWGDWSDGKYNPRLVSKIQNNVNKIIGKEYMLAEEEIQPKVNSGLGKMFGDMLLPPDGFGTKPSGERKIPEGGGLSRKRGITFDAETNGIKYFSDKMIIPFLLQTAGKKKIKHAAMNMLIDSESRKIEIIEWEEKMCLTAPFLIKEFRIDVDSIDGENVSKVLILKENDEVKYSGIAFKMKVSNSGSGYGISINSEMEHSMKIRIRATVQLNRKDVKPTFIYEKGDASNA